MALFPGIRRAVLAAVLIACAGCTGPLALIPWGPLLTPMLTSALASRGGDDTERRLLAELEAKQDWAGIQRFAADKLRQDPMNSNWWIVTGYAAFRAGDYPLAINALTRATERNPEDIDGWNLLGEVQRLAGQPGRAVQTLDRAVAIDRTSSLTYYLLGEALRDAGRLDRAVAAFRESLQLSPENPLTWFGLGTVYARSGAREDLRVVIERLQKLDPALAQQLAQMRPGNR